MEIHGIDLEKFTPEELVDILKAVVDKVGGLTITGCYGASDFVDSSSIGVAQEPITHMCISKGDVVVHTQIMTG